MKWKQENWLREPPVMVCRVTCGSREGWYVPKHKIVLHSRDDRTWVYHVEDTELVPERQEVYQVTKSQPDRLSNSEESKRWLQEAFEVITNYLIMRDDDADTPRDSLDDGDVIASTSIIGRASRT